MPCSAQNPINGGETITRPIQTKLSNMCTGKRAFSTPSTSITTLAPSFLSQAPSVVTYKVLSCRRMSQPPPSSCNCRFNQAVTLPARAKSRG